MKNIASEFKSTLVALLDELIDMFPQEIMLLLARVYVKDRVSETDAVNTFVLNVLPYKESIVSRDEEFFLQGKANFFSELDSSNVNHFKTIWKSNALDTDDKQMLWKWFDTFVYLAEKHVESKKN